MEANEYRCAVCQQVYAKAISDEEAMAATQTYWPGIEQQDCGVVCDDCWQKISPEAHPQEYRDSQRELFLQQSFAEAVKRIALAYSIPPEFLGGLRDASPSDIEELERRYRQMFLGRKQEGKQG